MNKDQFGYYLCGNLKTYSKIEALEHAHLINTPIQWIFNDAVFSTHPWHIDTQEDIKKLYKKRAEQIREKYDYIVIWYGGGADSFTVVNSFRENNIHVDEIAQYHAYEGEKTWNCYMNKEVKDVAIPQTLEFLKSMPHTKHRLVDYTSIIKSVYSEDDNKFNFIYKANKSFGPDQLARTYFREKILDYRNIIASGKKLCFVWGCDLPPVVYDETNDYYYLQFRDIIDGAAVGPRTQMLGRQEEHDELFYWSPDAMDLMARQAHIIMNYLRNPPKQDLDSLYLSTDYNTYAMSYSGGYIPLKNRRASTKVKDQLYFLTQSGFQRLLYPDWKIETFSLGKQAGTIFNLRDRWWFDAHQNQDQKLFGSAFESLYKKFDIWGFTNFKNGVVSKILQDKYSKGKEIESCNQQLYTYKHLYKKFDDLGLININSENNDFRNLNMDLCYSKRYFLEKFKNL